MCCGGGGGGVGEVPGKKDGERMERDPACQPQPRTEAEWDAAPGLPPWDWDLRDLPTSRERESGGGGKGREDCVPGVGSAARGGCWER